MLNAPFQLNIFNFFLASCCMRQAAPVHFDIKFCVSRTIQKRTLIMKVDMLINISATMVGIASRESHPWLKTQFLHAELVFHQIMGDNISLSNVICIVFFYVDCVCRIESTIVIKYELANCEGLLVQKTPLMCCSSHFLWKFFFAIYDNCCFGWDKWCLMSFCESILLVQFLICTINYCI